MYPGHTETKMDLLKRFCMRKMPLLVSGAPSPSCEAARPSWPESLTEPSLSLIA